MVIVGPIASGKSTVAGALGKRFRALGRTVAVLDLDDVVDTIGGFGDLLPEHFEQAQRRPMDGASPSAAPQGRPALRSRT